MKKTQQIRRLVTFGALGSVIAMGAIVACAGLPAVSFVGGEADAGPDATKALDAGLDTGTLDAGDGEASSGDDDGGDDAAVGASILCGDASVSGCDQCAGSPLACKKGTRNQCVADCTDCAAGWLPCWHCPGGAAPRGTCDALNMNGVLACTGGTLCACDAATDCPESPGSSAVCGTADAAVKANKCHTCGEAQTSGAACATDDGGTGTCNTGTSTPTCE